MKKLNEKTATVRCRQVDLALAKEIMEPARKQYAAAFGTEAPALSLDQATFLPPPPAPGGAADVATCCGGVTLASADGRICCNNTLDDRVKIAYHANLPAIRGRLFGVEPRAR
jgi:V-type H+-transporting ATPase subunit E